MDDLFLQIETFDKAMGSISIFKDGKPVYEKAFGMADVINNQKADIDTKYRIGSISKTFTAVIIMKLIEDKKLSLSTPLSQFYPEISNAESITIEHLLRHRSGINSFTETDDYLSWNTQKKSKS